MWSDNETTQDFNKDIFFNGRSLRNSKKNSNFADK